MARRQLLALGVGPGAIDHWLATGRLHMVRRGVYAVGHTARVPRASFMSAVLACGLGAVVSHRSAAELWELLDDARAVVDVTATTHRSRPGLVIHRSHLADADRAEVAGIPVTSVSRTLLDIAAVVPERRLRRAWDAAERRGLFDLTAIEELLNRCPRRRGAKPVRKLIAEATAPEPSRSELESLFMDLCRDHNLPLPSLNVPLHGYEVDALWRHSNLAVELDSYEFHRTRRSFEQDRLKTEALQLAGYTVVHFSYRRIVYEAASVAATLRRFLSGPEP